MNLKDLYKQRLADEKQKIKEHDFLEHIYQYNLIPQMALNRAQKKLFRNAVKLVESTLWQESPKVILPSDVIYSRKDRWDKAGRHTYGCLSIVRDYYYKYVGPNKIVYLAKYGQTCSASFDIEESKCEIVPNENLEKTKKDLLNKVNAGLTNMLKMADGAQKYVVFSYHSRDFVLFSDGKIFFTAYNPNVINEGKKILNLHEPVYSDDERLIVDIIFELNKNGR